MAEQTFKEFELAGWQERASSYDAWVGRRTHTVAARLVDATGIGAGMRFLDLCCGPGYSAGEAVARGAEALGIDLAPAMIAEARRNVPQATFAVGDAEALALPDASRDGAVCAFGMLHLAEPERAIAEVFRVLTPGGRFAWTVWGAGDADAPLSTIAHRAIRDAGNANVALPDAPPRDLFSSEANARAALERAGFTGVRCEPIPMTFRAANADEVWEWYMRGTVRTAALLKRQTPEALARIKAAILEGAGRFGGPDGSIAAPQNAVMYVARKSAHEEHA